MRVENPIHAIPTGKATADWASKPAQTVPGFPNSSNSEPVDSIVLPRTLDLAPVQFAIEADSASKEIVVKMVDQTTGEVVRQIPSEAILRMARAINELMAAQQSDSSSQG